MLLETGIFVSHVVWLFRTRKLRKQAKLAGQSFDDLAEAQPYQVQRSGTEKEREPSSTDIEKGNMHADDYPEVQASSHAQREGEDDKQISLKDHESGSFKTDNLRKAKAHPSVRVEDGEADRALSMDIGYEQVKVHNLPEVQAFLDRRRETRPSSNDIQKDDL